ncbi:MAG: hemerythrin domain-containing protein [Deltaproteobacteria bacterium]|nr:hemerythrin domain-containing protein [Deltaproteobacteria bacterium]
MVFQNIENATAKIAGEHKLITDYVERFLKAYKHRDKAFFGELSAFMSLMEKELYNHFSLEERVFFPAAVHGAKDYDITLMVLNLQKEHGLLETRLSGILKNKYAIVSGRMENPLVKTIADFLKDLGSHAEMEMRDLFPAMDENIRCKTLMERYLSMFSKDEQTAPDISDEKPGTRKAAADSGNKKESPSQSLSAYSSVSRLAGEHKLMATHVTRFERALRDKDEKFFAELSTFLEFLKKDLHSHFILEELSFFPAALNGCFDYDMTMTVLNLQRQHGVFETELQYIRENKQIISAGWIKNPVIERIAVFLRALKSHVILELNQVFPNIGKDDACRNLLIKYLKDMKSRD